MPSLKVAAEHEKLSVGNVTPRPKRVELPAPRARWSRPAHRSGLQPESGQQHTSKVAQAARTLGAGHARARCMSPQQKYDTIVQFKPSLAKAMQTADCTVKVFAEPLLDVATTSGDTESSSQPAASLKLARGRGSRLRCHEWAFLCSTACTQKRQCGRFHTQA